MKKIFAIALALVMVLAMTSAFASPCTAGFDWTNTTYTNCGKAKVEVVPFVKVNTACGWEYQVSECASAVTTEWVFYGLKLTVDANPDAAWFAALPQDANNTTGLVEPSVKVTYEGFDGNPGASYAGIQAAMYDASNTVEKTYFFKADTNEWKLLDETKGITMADVVKANSPYVMTNKVGDASKAKVCATLASKYDFVRGTVGKYYVEYIKENGNMVLKVWEKQTATNPLAVYTIENDKVVKVDYTYAGSCAPYTAADVEAFFGIKYGTTITQKLVNSNFGWDDSFKDCFAWGSKTPSIVDAECVVAIPKTGDASVLAWLF